MSDMGLAYNASGQDQIYNICTLQQPDVLGVFPGNDGRKTVVRWTAPTSGTYSIQGRFQNIDHSSSDVSIIQNGNIGSPLFSDEVDAPGTCQQTTVTKPFSLTTSVNAADTIDFRVGWGDNSEFSFDGTGLAATITQTTAGPSPTPTPTPLVCPAGFADCDGNPANGCEVNLNTDSQNCGACGISCPSGSHCQNGTCVPNPSPTPTPTPTPTTPPNSLPHIGSFSFNGPTAPGGSATFAVSTDAGLAVRIQSTTCTPASDPSCEGSWTDLPDGNGGHMHEDSPGNYSLTTTFYPIANGIYFRAISSKTGFSDGKSDAFGPYDLATLPHIASFSKLGPSKPGDSITFGVGTVAGLAVRIQSTTCTPASDPSCEGSWADLPDGNGGHLHEDSPGNYSLTTTSYPKANGIYFRALSSKTGYTDGRSDVQGPFDLVAPSVQLIGLEVTQGVQNLKNDTPLVAGRATFVRAYVKNVASSPGPVSATASLTARDTATGTVLGTIKNSNAGGKIKILPQSVGGPGPLRSNLDDSFYFELPNGTYLGQPDWTKAGTVEFTFTANEFAVQCNEPDGTPDCKTTVQFQKRRPFTFRLIPTSGTDSKGNQVYPSLADEFETLTEIVANFPISGLGR